MRPGEDSLSERGSSVSSPRPSCHCALSSRGSFHTSRYVRYLHLFRYISVSYLYYCWGRGCSSFILSLSSCGINQHALVGAFFVWRSFVSLSLSVQHNENVVVSAEGYRCTLEWKWLGRDGRSRNVRKQDLACMRPRKDNSSETSGSP